MSDRPLSASEVESRCLAECVTGPTDLQLEFKKVNL